ncbi:MAG TPA: cyclic nucleotide-binding domain-containing protein [Chthoniobacter sp.]|nr:cyclic nucleotide-binding domain-containing protein [Chthoniobacter sp.]
MHRATFQPGEFIFREGDESSDAYWVLSGQVEISIETPQGRKVLTILEEGEIFGEMGMIDDLPRAASARAISETEVDVVNERDFQYEVLRDQARLLPYIDTLFERLRSTNAMLRAEMARQRSSGDRPAPHDAGAVIPSPTPPEAGAITITTTERSAPLHPGGLNAAIRKFPFRIGREAGHEHEHDGLSGFGRVDLALPDHRPYSVSRGHCLIERTADGYFVRDCGSRLGTIVNGIPLGAEATETSAPLARGENRLILGNEEGHHEYLVTVT